MKPEEFDCPRMEGNTNYGKATWKSIGRWRKCCHCGSMHPEDVIRAVMEYGAQIIESTDKFYKRYIRLPGVSNASEGPIKFYTQHFSKENIKKYNALIDKSHKSKETKE